MRVNMKALSLRTRRFAAALEALSYLAILGALAAGVYSTLDPSAVANAIAKDHSLPDPLWDLGLLAKTLLALAVWISICALVYTLWHMARLFACYRGDAPINQRAAQAIRRIGQGFLAQAFLGILGTTIDVLILSTDAPVGQRRLSVGLNTDDLGLLLACGLLIMVGVVMAQAVEVARENQEFV